VITPWSEKWGDMFPLPPLGSLSQKVGWCGTDGSKGVGGVVPATFYVFNCTRKYALLTFEIPASSCTAHSGAGLTRSPQAATAHPTMWAAKQRPSRCSHYRGRLVCAAPTSLICLITVRYTVVGCVGCRGEDVFLPAPTARKSLPRCRPALKTVEWYTSS
jgi:hypothetical protein